MTTHKVTEEKVEDAGQGWFGQKVQPDEQGLPGHFSPPGQQGMPGVAHDAVVGYTPTPPTQGHQQFNLEHAAKPKVTKPESHAAEKTIKDAEVEQKYFEKMREKAVEAKKIADAHPHNSKKAAEAKAAQHKADEAWKKAEDFKKKAKIAKAETYFEEMKKKAIEAKKIADAHPHDNKKAEEAKAAQHKADEAWKKAKEAKQVVKIEEFEMVEVVVDQGFARLGASHITPDTAHSPGQTDQYGQRVHLGHENIVGRTASHPYGPQGHGEAPYHFERKVVHSEPEGKMVLNHLGQLVPEKKMLVRKKK